MPQLDVHACLQQHSGQNPVQRCPHMLHTRQAAHTERHTQHMRCVMHLCVQQRPVLAACSPIAALMIPILISWGRRYAPCLLGSTHAVLCTCHASRALHGHFNCSLRRINGENAAAALPPVLRLWVSRASCRRKLFKSRRSAGRWSPSLWCACPLPSVLTLQVQHQPQEAAHPHELCHCAGRNHHADRHLHKPGHLRTAGGQVRHRGEPSRCSLSGFCLEGISCKWIPSPLGGIFYKVRAQQGMRVGGISGVGGAAGKLMH